MGLSKDMIPVLAVALITWCGLYLYILRLDRMTAKQEEQLHDLPRPDDAIPS